MTKYFKEFKLLIHKKKREKISFFNFFEKFKFKPVRIYFLTNIKKNSIRGRHAHKDTRQIFVCTSGSVLINLYNKDGLIKKIKLAEKKNLCLMTLKPVWLELKNFSSNCKLLVLADKKFSKKDYITDRQKIL